MTNKSRVERGINAHGEIVPASRGAEVGRQVVLGVSTEVVGFPGTPGLEPPGRAVTPAPGPVPSILLISPDPDGLGGQSGQEVVGVLVRHGGQVPGAGVGGPSLAVSSGSGPGLQLGEVFVAAPGVVTVAPAAATYYNFNLATERVISMYLVLPFCKIYLQTPIHS